MPTRASIYEINIMYAATG